MGKRDIEIEEIEYEIDNYFKLEDDHLFRLSKKTGKWYFLDHHRPNTTQCYHSIFLRFPENRHCHIYTHRMIWYIVHRAWPGPGLQIDHINRVKYDNRISNLRVVTPSENMINSYQSQNQRADKYLGVYKCTKNFQSKIKINGKCIHLGMFPTAREAAIARNLYIIKNDLGHRYILNRI